MRFTGFLSLLAAALLGCGKPGADQPPPAPVPENAEVTVEVENHNSQDVVIYMLVGGISARLGMVTGLRTEVISIPWKRLGGRRDIRLQAHPIGGTDLLSTERIVVEPWTIIHWMLETGLARSSVSVYAGNPKP